MQNTASGQLSFVFLRPDAATPFSFPCSIEEIGKKNLGSLCKNEAIKS